MITKEHIGKSIRELRQKKGMRIKDVALRMKPKPVSKDTLSRIERGVGNYTIDMLFRIADVLGCGIDDFCSDPRPPTYSSYLDEAIKHVVQKAIEEEKAKYKGGRLKD